MRYYFNSGGKIAISWGVTGGTADAKYNEWANLATECGTYTLFGRTSGKVGGGGSTPVQTTTGFDGLTSTPTSIFKQLENTGPYTANYIQVNGSVSGAVLTFTSLWKDDAADSVSWNKAIYNVLDQVDGSKTTTFTASPAATTHITATWGSPTWSTTVNTQT